MKKYIKSVLAFCIATVLSMFSIPKLNFKQAAAVELGTHENYTYFSFLQQFEYHNMIFAETTTRYHSADGPFMLVDYLGDEQDIVVPEYVRGRKVEGIYEYAFYDNQNIRNVTLPDSIYYFGREIFGYSSVETVNIPKSLKVIP